MGCAPVEDSSPLRPTTVELSSHPTFGSSVGATEGKEVDGEGFRRPRKGRPVDPGAKGEEWKCGDDRIGSGGVERSPVERGGTPRPRRERNWKVGVVRRFP